ncbi:MAG: acriflavin resistance protein, partial [Bacteriovoracaceae bacterium]|nr:acriflavin resistance protein [Bacteriovoracaceae bacterium]
MNLSEISIRRPVFAWMIMVGLIIFGALSFKRLGVSQLPDVDFPVVGISLSLPGAAPEVIESQVIDPVEDAVMEIGGIRNITSNSQQSSGSISIEFELDRNIDTAIQEVQDRIAQARSLLPVDLIAPTVRKTNPEDQPILWIALVSDGSASLMDSMMYARNYLYDQFGTVPGVGDINLGGYVDPALRVWVDLDKMNKYELTADDILQAIETEHVEVPAGRIENSSHEWNVRLMGEAVNPTDFGKIRINKRSVLGTNYRPQQISDVATVEESTVDIRKIARFNGQPAVGLGILKQHGSNAVEVAKLVREKVKEIAPTIPKQFKLSIRSDSTRFIKQSVDELNFMLLLSALLTSLVCYLFLGSWTSTMNVLMAIPTSIVGAFIVIYFFGFTLNTFTLLGLSLAIGVVVDDAIMMLENIVRHRELGEKKREAALKGSKEITFAALAATIAVAAIFLPVIFMKGVIGRYLYQYGITVTAAVGLSLIEALTLTPMRCSQYLKVQHQSGGFAGKVDALFHRLAGFYQKILGVLLLNRWKTIFVTLALFFASLIIGKHLDLEMMPAQDQSQIMLRFKGKVGSSLD